MKTSHALIVVLLSLGLVACGPSDSGASDDALDHSGLFKMDPDKPSPGEHISGGAATVFKASKDAFSQRPRGIAKQFRLDGAFTTGDHIFRTPQKGIGPLLNTNTCQGCHLNDGRGVLPKTTVEPFSSMLIKIGGADGTPDPMYGSQIQTFSAPSFLTSDSAAGLPAYNADSQGEFRGEAFAYIDFEYIKGHYADGRPYELRRPIYKITDLSYGPFRPDIAFSPRIAPQVFGAGLLEAIPEENIQALADPNDANGDGISGRVSWVQDVLTGEKRMGRFTYKAQSPNVLQQVASAFRDDSGITNSIFPDEPCSELQSLCIQAAQREAHADAKVDISNDILAFVEFYNRTLAVPSRRGYAAKTDSWKREVANGRRLFLEIGCAGCHTPRHLTGEAKGSVLGQPSLGGLQQEAPPIDVLSNQLIYPYTDLLLHDMGGQCEVVRETELEEPCDGGEICLYVQRCTGLADGLAQGNASGSEWKTPPLWGIGLVQSVNPNANFLHDGRARSIEEAVIWHSGEAAASQQRFMGLGAADRNDLLAFLKSL